MTIQFSLDGRRIDRLEISPRGAVSCDATWTALVSFPSQTYGAAQSREGNTVRWRADTVAATATVLEEVDAFCDAAASLTASGRP